MDPWQSFEKRTIESAPAGTYVRRLNTPPPPSRLLKYLAAQLRSTGVHLEPWAQTELNRASENFTPRQPYDLQITAPAVVLGGDKPRHGFPWPQVCFALELKSSATKRLPIVDIKPHQIDGLVAARSAGWVAGLLIEFRATEPAEVVHVPVSQFLSWLSRSERKSLPLADALEIGERVDYLPKAPRQHYERFNLAGLMRPWGADV